MQENLVKMVPGRTDAEIAAEIKTKAQAALEPLCALMQEARQNGMLLMFDTIAPDAFGRYRPVNLRLEKHY